MPAVPADNPVDTRPTPGQPLAGRLRTLAQLLFTIAFFAALLLFPSGWVPPDVAPTAAIVLAAALAAWAFFNPAASFVNRLFSPLTLLLVLAGGVLAPPAIALAATLGERAHAAAFIAAVVAGCALLVWAAYKESLRTTALGAVATGIARALLFGWSIVLLPLAFLLVFGNLLHILPEVKDDPSSDDTWQAGVVMALIAVIWFGVPAGAVLGLMGWAFGRPSPPGPRPPGATDRGSPATYVDTREKALDG